MPKNWNKYFSKDERQRKGNLETLACTNYAYNNTLEAVANYKKFTPETTEWAKDRGYINFNGNWNFSDRALAKMSGTSKEGNYPSKVIDTAENRGLVPEIMWPFDAETWQEYYKKIPDDVLDTAEEFHARFDITHEWVRREDWGKRIKESPIFTTVWAWKEENGIYVRPENETTTNHAIVVYRKSRKINGRKVWDIQDSYPPFSKPVEANNFSHGGYLVDIIDKNNLNIMEFVKKHDLKWIQNKETGQFGRIMRKKLYTIESNDRGALILLDAKVRNNGIRISDKIWRSLPKKEF